MPLLETGSWKFTVGWAGTLTHRLSPTNMWGLQEVESLLGGWKNSGLLSSLLLKDKNVPNMP